jgi:hypothetical protein
MLDWLKWWRKKEVVREEPEDLVIPPPPTLPVRDKVPEPEQVPKPAKPEEKKKPEFGFEETLQKQASYLHASATQTRRDAEALLKKLLAVDGEEKDLTVQPNAANGQFHGDVRT